MAEGHTIETYGHTHNSQAAAAPSRLADSFVWRGTGPYITTHNGQYRGSKKRKLSQKT